SADGRIMGTYLHGLFASDAYRSRLLQSFGLSGEGGNYRESVDRALDEVANGLEKHLDLRFPEELNRSSRAARQASADRD
ncbi:hypothetical protein ACC736_39345, partial [Rhizobium ruizarguesonis]